MGGQVLGGGVIVLVAVVLWLVYLLPSWHSRYRYDAAERNAVRLNQALRVLAETSETPQEVRLELNARTAAAQHKIAKRVRAEREDAELALARAQLEAARADAATARVVARADAQTARERAKLDARAAKDAARLEAARVRADAAQARAEADLDRARARRDAARAAAPDLRRARARRRVRLAATLLAATALAGAAWGAVHIAAGGSALALVLSASTVVLSLGILHRMATVQRRASVAAVVPVAAPVVRASQHPDVSLADERAWTPRELPRPLTASTGSHAAAVLDGAAAREALRQAEIEEAMRERAARLAPASIEFARSARVDDAEIEAHVRRVLEQRAAAV